MGTIPQYEILSEIEAYSGFEVRQEIASVVAAGNKRNIIT